MLHFFFIPVYLSFSLNILAAFNIVCLLAWPVALLLNLKGHKYAPLLIANAEVLSHASWDVIFSGQGTGFNFYIMILTLFIILAAWGLTFKISLSVLNAIACGVIYYFSFIKAPITAESGPHYFSLLHISNLVFMFFLICLGAFFYRRAMLKVEGQLEHTIDQLQAELSEAADYVKSSLPSPLKSKVLATQWEFLPSASLGGDAFGYHWIDNDHFAFYLLDVSGHGVGAALLSVSVMNTLRSQTLPDVDFCEPDQVLSGLNRAFPAEDHNDMFFTTWYGVYSRQDRQIAFASAGHHAALLFSDPDEPAIELRTTNAAIGAIEKLTYEKKIRQLTDRSYIYVFSDGVYEFVQADGSQWRFSDFARFLGTVHQGEGKDLARLVDAAKTKKQAELFEDDFTILKISIGK
ncbi:MAG: serine/threonine-protein phosphatase [Deltaproteobacteria bacterium]|nr:serine/threonine-protein phosphatase [Deltaproteobacteria bacterium]